MFPDLPSPSRTLSEVMHSLTPSYSFAFSLLLACIHFFYTLSFVYIYGQSFMKLSLTYCIFQKKSIHHLRFSLISFLHLISSLARDNIHCSHIWYVVQLWFIVCPHSPMHTASLFRPRTSPAFISLDCAWELSLRFKNGDSLILGLTYKCICS